MKVAIVCGAPSSEFLAPFGDKSWEIWVLGNRVQRYLDKRITRIFEIHDHLPEQSDPGSYAKRLLSLGVPVIVGEKFPVQLHEMLAFFPYEEVERMFGSTYLTSSPAYMIAYAVLNGATEIAIYGVDLSISDHEYFWQRPCVEAWIGFAKGRGIKVTIPEVSHIGKSKYVEGRHWNGQREAQGAFTEDGLLTIAEKHVQQRDSIKQDLRELELKMAMHEGAQQVYQQLAKVARAVEAGVDVKSLLETTVIK